VIVNLKHADTTCSSAYSETCLNDMAFYRTNRKCGIPVLSDHEEGNHGIEGMSTALSSTHTEVKVKLSLSATRKHTGGTENASCVCRHQIRGSSSQ